MSTRLRTHTIERYRVHVMGLAWALFSCTTLTTHAQSYPQHPIRVVQGFAVGGNADAIARVLGAEMSKTLGQPLVIEAATGAGGTLASAAVARAAPDGYTLLLATGGHAVAGAIYNKLPYETVKSFEMVSTITYFPFFIVVRADSKMHTLHDLFASARAEPVDGLAFGSAGIGTTQHLSGELLAKLAKIKLLHVPYRGDSAATAAVLGGEVPFIIAPATAISASVRAGKLRALAVTGPQRWLDMPDVPTIAEQGIPGYDVRSWAGWMLPTGSSTIVIKRLNDATQQALLAPDVRDRLRQMGGEAHGSTPGQMTRMVESELARWTQVVNSAGIPKL